MSGRLCHSHRASTIGILEFFSDSHPRELSLRGMGERHPGVLELAMQQIENLGDLSAGRSPRLGVECRNRSGVGEAKLR